MMAFAATVEPMRVANKFSGQTLYQWHVITPDGGSLASSSGVGILADASIETAPKLDTLLVVSGLTGHLFNDSKVFAWLRRNERAGCKIGALSDGAFVLAKAGLLDGHRCTIHWQCQSNFRETFPTIEVTDDLYEIDRKRMTASGGTASMDLMLKLIELDHGRALAIEVAETFLHERIREEREHQRMPLRLRLGLSHPKLLQAIGIMEENLEEPLTLADLAEETELSTRQLERLFHKYLGCTPRRYYLELRLKRARSLLTQSSLPVMEVALACGFVSASHFAKCYRELFKELPRSTRSGQPGTG